MILCTFSLSFLGIFEVPEKLALAFIQQTELLRDLREHVVCLRAVQTGRRETVQITAGRRIFLPFSFDRRRLLARDGRVSTAQEKGREFSKWLKTNTRERTRCVGVSPVSDSSLTGSAGLPFGVGAY